MTETKAISTPRVPRELSRRQRQTVLYRKRLIDLWNAARVAAAADGEPERNATQAFLSSIARDSGSRLSRTTLFTWNAAYEARGFAGLVDGRGQRAASGAKPI